MDDAGVFVVAGLITAAFFGFTALLAGPLQRQRGERPPVRLERRRWR